MVEWTNEEVIHFLECYEAEPCIWDLQDQNHKNKRKIAEAWSRISELLNKSVKDLKNKKEILMITFRKHLNKKLDSIRSGTGDVYEPVWFAYPTMERFLLPIYALKNSQNFDTQSPMTLEVIGGIANDNEVNKSVSSILDDNNRAPVSTSIKSSSFKHRRHPRTDLSEQKMTRTNRQFTNSSRHDIEQRPPPPPPNDQDECDLYANLFARKLRELPEDERKIFMYEIDGLFVERIYKKRCNRDTPCS